MWYKIDTMTKKYITSNPKIMSGDPVIVGTRIPISRILHLLKTGYDIGEIQKQYSWVDIKTLQEVIEELAYSIEKKAYAS